MSTPKRGDLAEELHRRVERDQQARYALDDPPTDDQLERMRAVDEDNTGWLDSMVAEHGWPGHHLVGIVGAHDAWLLAQHADARPELQRSWLLLLRAAVESGDADRANLAYLEDRVAVHQRLPQRYGTQWMIVDSTSRLSPLADPQHVNEFRAECRLPPLAADDIANAYPAGPHAGAGA